jgi:lipopolysaccharide transport system ATP-binding protein
MSSEEVVVSARGLGKTYSVYRRPSDRLLQMLPGRRSTAQRFEALRDVSFDLHRGETVGIIGQNGSGKSTLLQILCGTLAPTAGDVRVRGRVAALLELGAGFNVEFTGRENVMLSASVAGIPRERALAMFDSVAAFADIGDFIDQPVKTYSSGMFVRLAFALQVHTAPEVFLVDEAMAVGDHRFVQKCYARMAEMKASGASLLLVSHDTTAIKMLCDRALWLHEGKVRLIGAASEVVDAYRQWADGIEETVVHAGLDVEHGPKRRLQLERLQLLDANGTPRSSFEHGKPVQLEARIRNRGCEPGTPLRFGFSIRNNRGIEITGSNTDAVGFAASAPAVGDTLVLRGAFTLPLLAAGRYSFSANVDAMGEEGGVTEVLVRDGLVMDIDERVKVFTLIGLDTRFSATVTSSEIEVQEETKC